MKTFKRIFAIVLALVFICATAGCGTKQVTSEYWEYEEVEVEDENANSDDVVSDDANSQESTENSSIETGASGGSNDKSNNATVKPSTNKNNSAIKVMDVGTKGANGKDYSNYNPYEGIEKYKGTTLKFASWINHANDEFSTAIDSFYENYGIKIESVFCVQANYLEQVTALIAAGKAPDIVVENAQYPSSLQIAQPFSASGLDVNEPFWDQNAIKGMNPGSNVYFVNSVNSFVQPFGVTIYQRDIMEANGIKTPQEYYDEGDWTLENFVKCAKEFAALGDDYSGCVVEGLHSRGIYGGQLVKYENGKFINNLTSKACIDAGKFELELQNMKLTGEMDDFIRGKVGIIIRDTYALKQTGYIQGVDGDSLGFTYLPKLDKNAEEVTTGFWRGYGIGKGSKNAAAAGMALRYLLDYQNIDLVGKAFFNEEAAQFFYDAVAKNSKLKHNYDYGYGIAYTNGVGYRTYMDGATEPTQIATVYESHNNELQAAVDKATKILNSAK